MTTAIAPARAQPAPRKFTDPDRTAKGEPRARVALKKLETLWINTGTLCNIACKNCYILSSPTNDDLVYISRDETRAFLDEARALGVREIGFTGGEPFLNPDMPGMLEDALAAGFEVLVLTNAMRPMQRPRIRNSLLALRAAYPESLTMRISLDHYTKALHEDERGTGTWDIALAGIDWLGENGFRIAIAGRTIWGEDEVVARQGYEELVLRRRWPVDPADARQLVLFPEMRARPDVPEITTACWGILGIHPSEMMCATSRMVVKRKGAERPTVLPCTLIAFDTAFEMGSTLANAARADGGMFAKGAVKLCHENCATFCVLGGGSCS